MWHNPYTGESVDVQHVANNPVQSELGSSADTIPVVQMNKDILGVTFDINLD